MTILPSNNFPSTSGFRVTFKDDCDTDTGLDVIINLFPRRVFTVTSTCTLIRVCNTPKVGTHHRYIKNHRLSKYLPYLTSKIRHWKGTRGLQNYPKFTRPARSSVQHRECTGPSHTTRHASRYWQCTTLADDTFHSYVYSTAGTLIIYYSYISMPQIYANDST